LSSAPSHLITLGRLCQVLQQQILRLAVDLDDPEEPWQRDGEGGRHVGVEAAFPLMGPLVRAALADSSSAAGSLAINEAGPAPRGW
jgi:hypothetical protein